MNSEQQNVEQFSPQQLLAGFTRGRFFFWIVLALSVHIVVIAVLSLGYIRDTWIDPEGAARRKAEVEAAAQAAAAVVPKTATATANATSTPATATTPAPAPATEQAILEQRKNTPVVKAITEAAKTNEIPRQPDDIGISLNDTNVK